MVRIDNLTAHTLKNAMLIMLIHCWVNAGQCCRRWVNIKTTLVQRVLFAGLFEGWRWSQSQVISIARKRFFYQQRECNNVSAIKSICWPTMCISKTTWLNVMHIDRAYDKRFHPIWPMKFDPWTLIGSSTWCKQDLSAASRRPDLDPTPDKKKRFHPT